MGFIADLWWLSCFIIPMVYGVYGKYDETVQGGTPPVMFVGL